MDKNLYDLIYSDIQAQFGAGDTVEPEDRKFCAEQIVEHLQQYGYQRVIPNVDFVVRVSDLVNIREKAYNDARKEMAKEIFQWLYNLCKGNFSLNASEVRQIAKDHGLEVDKDE